MPAPVPSVLEEIILTYSTRNPRLSYAGLARELKKQTAIVTPGHVHGVFERNGMKRFIDRLDSINYEASLRGPPVNTERTENLSRERYPLETNYLPIPSRKHELVVYQLAEFRPADLDRFYISVFFDLFTNTGFARTSLVKNDIRLMDALDSYLISIRQAEGDLPDAIITSASHTVAGSSEENVFRIRLANDGIKQFISPRGKSPVQAFVAKYVANLKDRMIESADSIADAYLFDLRNFDYEMPLTCEATALICNELNRHWEKLPRFDGQIGGQLIGSAEG